MKISIFTDASVVNKSAGFAFYIGCTAGKIQKAGRLKTTSGNISIAELHCLANALHTLKHCKFKPVTSVCIYMDELGAVNYFNNDSRGMRGTEQRKVLEEIYFLMLDICIANGNPIRHVNSMFSFYHVKAHTGNQDKLSLINAWCDVNCRKYAKQSAKKPVKNKGNDI